MSRCKDLTGRKFGELTVVRRAPNKGRFAMWECSCSCGQTVVCYASNLPHIKHCSNKVHYYTPNEYRVENGVAYLKVTNGADLIVDEEDLEKVLKHRWSYNKARDAYYTIENHSSVYISRYIMDAPKGFDVDHINHNRADNRKNNLRVVTRQQNLANRVNFDSKIHRGVRLTPAGTYHAYICINKQQIGLGTYENLSDAINSRLAAEKHYHGSFAPNGGEQLGV